MNNTTCSIDGYIASFFVDSDGPVRFEFVVAGLGSRDWEALLEMHTKRMKVHLSMSAITGTIESQADRDNELLELLGGRQE